MQVEILDRTDRFRRRRRLTELVRRLATNWELGEREVTIVLVDDPTIAELNARDRAVEGPTDVLSYPLHEPDDAGFPTLPHLGDVIVSLDTARRQAREGGALLWHEVAVLVAHGLLHLLGFDHRTDAEWERFHSAQAEALAIALELDHVAMPGAR